MRRPLSLLVALAATIAAAAPADPRPAARPTAVPPGVPPAAERGWIGVSLDRPRSPTQVSEAEERSAPEGALDVPDGVRIGGVVRDSPADSAGLRGGDVVVALDGQPLESIDGFIRAVSTRGPGAWVELEVWRNGTTRRVTARLEPFPESSDRFRQIRIGWAGIEPLDVPLQLRELWGGTEERGVLVGATSEGGPAELGGVLPGDLVLAIDGEPVATATELVRTISRAGDGAKLELELSRQGMLLTVEVLLDEEPPEEAEGNPGGRNRPGGPGRRSNGR